VIDHRFWSIDHPPDRQDITRCRVKRHFLFRKTPTYTADVARLSLPRDKYLRVGINAFACKQATTKPLRKSAFGFCDLQQDLKSKIQTQRREKKKETYMLNPAETVEKTTSKTSNAQAGQGHAYR
jgi:hypothetical protein